jgi:hypothetical protein
MPHLLMAKYTPTVSRQTLARTAIPRFIVSSITSYSTDGVQRLLVECGAIGAKLIFGKFAALQHDYCSNLYFRADQRRRRAIIWTNCLSGIIGQL